MTNYLIYRHGSNAANQSRKNVQAIAIIAAESKRHAIDIARLEFTVYANQFLSAVAESRAKNSDWDEVVESQRFEQFNT